MENITNSTNTTIITDPDLIIGLFDKDIFGIIITVIVVSIVSVPFICSVSFSKFSIISEIFTYVNTFVRSYNRILTTMISDSIYELQFMQTVACLSFINSELLLEAKYFSTTLRKFIFLDFFDKLSYSSQKAEGMSIVIKGYFTNSFMDNSNTFVIFIIFGIMTLLLILITRKCETEQANNQIVTTNTGEDVTLFFKNTRPLKFKKCSVEAWRSYFLYNYFIRIYQVTMTKVTFVCLVVIKYSYLPTSSVIDLIVTCFVMLFWVIGLPISMFNTTRKKQNNLMSPDMILQYGTLYLSFRGSSKDVYAFLLQIKFAILPIICVLLERFPTAQLVFLILLYLTNILFITICMPFFKVSKVFTEAISEGILMSFCIVILIVELIPNIKTNLIPRYTLMLLVSTLLLLRLSRITIDTVYRILDLRKIKTPDLKGLDVAATIKSKKKIEEENIPIKESQPNPNEKTDEGLSQRTLNDNSHRNLISHRDEVSNDKVSNKKIIHSPMNLNDETTNENRATNKNKEKSKHDNTSNQYDNSFSEKSEDNDFVIPKNTSIIINEMRNQEKAKLHVSAAVSSKSSNNTKHTKTKIIKFPSNFTKDGNNTMIDKQSSNKSNIGDNKSQRDNKYGSIYDPENKKHTLNISVTKNNVSHSGSSSRSKESKDISFRKKPKKSQNLSKLSIIESDANSPRKFNKEQENRNEISKIVNDDEDIKQTYGSQLGNTWKEGQKQYYYKSLDESEIDILKNFENNLISKQEYPSVKYDEYFDDLDSNKEEIKRKNSNFSAIKTKIFTMKSKGFESNKKLENLEVIHEENTVRPFDIDSKLEQRSSTSK